jgi:hypothetical protein
VGAAGRALPLPRRRGRAPALAAVAAAAAAALAAALGLTAGHDARTAPSARAYDGLLAGAPLQRARCRHWQAAPPAERRAAVHALSATIGGASTTGGVGTTLPDGRVSALFDRVCSTPQTAGFALYLIYARAAAFSRVHVPPT